MGEVWKARDTRIVAMKFSQEKFSERFEREAKAIGALNHPNICTLHDVGPNYLMMEYVEGVPLKGPLPIRSGAETTRGDAARSGPITRSSVSMSNMLGREKRPQHAREPVFLTEMKTA
jgi:serine/threonine protein kinase